ncbi:MAG: hypothetical protein GTO63_34160 [Anaerolineae bacterium]|nr:hypothetical protein [Anaerolineae bacterium]NIN99682.1 hypothetical protein [Anaerolineae bacterium]NIQ82535.1 hypothetical protein [Anaerolineae bacterium]
MIRRFNLGDILLVKRLQGQGSSFDLETALLCSPAPLSMALLECLALNEGRCSTFVDRHSSTEQRIRGFIQAWNRADGLACDVAFIAPCLDGSPATSRLWCDLLDHLIVVKGHSGLQRVFAKIPIDGEATEIFRQTGFAAYARRRVLRLDQPTASIDPARPVSWRPLQEKDAWGLQRLWSATTPRPVQLAEGGRAERDVDGLLPWWKTRQVKHYVLSDAGEILAHLRASSAEDGHWMSIMVAPTVLGEVRTLLSESLSFLSARPDRPIYCAVREYQAGLEAALEDLGFQPLASELLMVKHTTVGVKVPVEKLSAAFEKGVETATPISTGNSYGNAA